MAWEAKTTKWVAGGIQKFLPQDLWDIAQTYVIPEAFLEDAPELIEMILRSKSIDTKEEKQNWFNLLPLMNTQQIEKLRAILIKEKTKLQEIEQKYEEKKMDIKKKYLMKRQEAWYIKQVATIKEQENEDTSKDKKEAEDLLNLI